MVGFALASLVLGVSGWLVTGPYREIPGAVDASIRPAIRQMQSPMWTALFLAVTKLGSTIYLIIIGSVAGVAFIFLRWFRSFFLFVIVMVGQAALHHGFKWLFERPRPRGLISYREIESFSFPSGHAISALCMYGMIAWIVTRRMENPAITAAVWICAILLIFLIGASRAYIGIHYPTDVLAGWLGGLVWTAAVMSIDRRTL
jgi:undecaprenyl-diphosphatase